MPLRIVLQFPWDGPAGTDERGFSLAEVIVASIIAVIAVLGMAFAFGNGRALINRYQIARDAMGVAQHEMEVLQSLPLGSDSLNAGSGVRVHGPFPAMLNSLQQGTKQWTVSWVDDPVDNAGGDSNPRDYKEVTVTIQWVQGSVVESVVLSRFFLGP